MRLYELAAAYQQLADLEDDAFAVALGQLEGGITDKAESIARLIRGLEAEAGAYEAEWKRLKAQQDSRLQKVERLRGYLQACLEAAGIQQVRGGLFTVRLRDNPPAVTVLDDLAVPLEFIRTKPPVAEVDRAAILAAWRESGIVPPGVQVHRSSRVVIS